MDWGTLVGVMLGASLTYVIQLLLRGEDKALKARLVLIDTLALLWSAEYQGLKAHLHRLRAYLEDARVDADLMQRLDDKAWECWRNGQEHGHDPEAGIIILSRLVDEYEALVDETHVALRRKLIR
jgi:hypothetical protein